MRKGLMGRGGFPPSETGSFSAHHTAQWVGFLFQFAGFRCKVSGHLLSCHPERSEGPMHSAAAGKMHVSHAAYKETLCQPRSNRADFVHLVRLLLSGTFLGGAFLIFSSDISHKIALGIAALAASCCLGVAAFRWPRKPRDPHVPET
jgi:hypothetical protein